MSKLASVAALSLAYNYDPEALSKRREALTKLSNPLKRRGALMVHDFVVDHPAFAQRLLGAKTTDHSETDFLDMGLESVIYRRGNQVYKVNQNSLGLSEPARHQLAKRKELEHQSLRRFMAEFLIAQQTVVDRHPIFPKIRAVQILQPFVKFEDPAIFAPNYPDIDKQALQQTCDKFPAIKESLHRFIQSGHTMFRETGMLPDTLGRSNVVIMAEAENPQLILIDGQPVTDRHPIELTEIVQELDMLSEALEVA